MLTRSIFRLAIATLAGGLFLSACSAKVEVGEKVMKEAEVESKAAAQLAAQLDQPEPNIDCPDDLKAEVGATMACVLSVDGDDTEYGVTVTVTSVDEKAETVKFDVKVADEPLDGAGDSDSEDGDGDAETTTTAA